MSPIETEMFLWESLMYLQLLNYYVKHNIEDESRGLVVKAEDSQLSGCAFKPWSRILDGVSKASYYIGKRNKDRCWGILRTNESKALISA